MDFLGVDVIERRDPLFLTPGPVRDVAWAQNTWLEPRFLPAPSIGKGAAGLKSIQRNWDMVETDEAGQRRRAELIRQKLPPVKARPLPFGHPAPTAPLGAWTLWKPDSILASPSTSSPFPQGRVLFEEDREGPPNRAYLKLWELFTLLGRAPEPGEMCLDLGGSPGGWAWVLARLGARVVSLDKAPLDPKVAALPGVEERLGSAFALDPAEAARADWFFSDVICYPGRLWKLLSRVMEAAPGLNLACTVKLQGEVTDWTELAPFRDAHGSRLLHLWHNKHELTWVRLAAEKTNDPDDK
nr:SAM-dependent methyltransferase [Desulfohalovibrio reitneri]